MNEFKSNQVRHSIELEGQKKRILLEIEAIIESFNQLIIQSIDPSTKTKKETEREITRIINNLFSELDTNIKNKLLELGLYETNFYSELINLSKEEENIKPINKSNTEEIILAGLFVGATLKDSLKYQKQVLNNSLNKELNIIYNQSTNINEARARIRTNSLKTNSTQTQSIVSTGTNNIVNTARLKTFEKNNIKKYQYVAILDSKTTKICKKLDGKVFLVDNLKAPRPPQHYNCRSYIVPVIDKEDKFTENDDFSDFVKDQKDKNLITDKNGNFKLRNKDIINLSDRVKKDKETFGI